MHDYIGDNTSVAARGYYVQNLKSLRLNTDTLKSITKFVQQARKQVSKNL